MIEETARPVPTPASGLPDWATGPRTMAALRGLRPGLRRKAADFVVEALADAGVPHLFGVIGAAVLPVFAATLGSRVQVIMAKHEGGAAFMADGYARVRGSLGACAATSGPGATNLITGVAAAFADSVPVIVLTGQVATHAFGKGALQESSPEALDVVDVFKRLTRYSTLVFRPDRLPDTWHRAVRAALGGRPGPVHLSLPLDVMEQPLDGIPSPRSLPRRPQHHDREAVRRAAIALAGARRPAILAGHGVILSEGAGELLAMAELLDAPVATTPKGKGAFPEDHRLALGPFGYAGSPLAQWHLLESGVDVLLAVGTSLSEWGTQGWDPRLQPSETLIHADVDPGEIGKNYHATVPLVGDAGAALRELAWEVRRQQASGDGLCGPRRRLALEPPADRPRFLDPEAMRSAAVPIKPQRLIHDLQQALPSDALVFVDGGANRSWMIHYWQATLPRTFFCATGMASMGFGVAAAVGGKFAAPDRTVICVSGDGGFLMNGMEVATAVHYGQQVIWVVLNDAGYGLANQALRRLGRPEVATSYPRVDCASVAESLGAQAFRIREPGQIDRALIARIIASGRPTLLDVEIDAEELAPCGDRFRALQDNTCGA